MIALLGKWPAVPGHNREGPVRRINVCQFYNLEWGKNRRAKDVAVFTTGWIAMLVLALVIALTGVRPLQLVNVSIIFGMVVMPSPSIRYFTQPQIRGSWENMSTRGSTPLSARDFWFSSLPQQSRPYR